MTTPYERINTYCKEHSKNNCVRDIAYCIYLQQYEELKKDPSLTTEHIDKILLSEKSIKSHVRSADEILSMQIEHEIERVKKEINTKSFGWSILSGVLGNIAYSLLLAILFYLAKDQIELWLVGLKGVN